MHIFTVCIRSGSKTRQPAGKPSQQDTLTWIQAETAEHLVPSGAASLFICFSFITNTETGSRQFEKLRIIHNITAFNDVCRRYIKGLKQGWATYGPWARFGPPSKNVSPLTCF